MRAREYIAAGLLEALPDLQIIDTLVKLGEPDPSKAGRVQIIRTSIEPAAEMKNYLESLDIWAVSNLIAPDEVEDDLDDIADDVTDAVRALGGIRWIRSTREMHPSGSHAYRIQITAKTH